MKYSTALKQAKASIRFLCLVVPIMWELFIWLRWWQLAAIAGFMSLFLIADVLLMRNIRRATSRDPEYLKRRIPGT